MRDVVAPYVICTILTVGNTGGANPDPRYASGTPLPRNTLVVKNSYASGISPSSHPRRSDKSPSVYSASSASPRYLHDDDFDTEATIAALQARVNSLESQQQAQHLTIQSAFFQDPPVDSDQD